MSAESAARERHASWREALDLWGYITTSAWLGTTAFQLHAARPIGYGAPEIEIEIEIEVDEVWVEGPDTQRKVSRSLQGAFLLAGKAHAQILPGERGALRVDVGDPSKPEHLLAHLHPFGEDNSVRRPLPAIPQPEQWVAEVEDVGANV